MEQMVDIESLYLNTLSKDEGADILIIEEYKTNILKDPISMTSLTKTLVMNAPALSLSPLLMMAKANILLKYNLVK